MRQRPVRTPEEEAERAARAAPILAQMKVNEAAEAAQAERAARFRAEREAEESAVAETLRRMPPERRREYREATARNFTPPDFYETLSPAEQEKYRAAAVTRAGTPEPAEPPKRLRAYSLAEVYAEDYRPSWLIQGWWPDGSYGQLAGQEKSFKSYIAMFMAAAVASGRPFLGQFPVRRQGSVVMFTGEGSRHIVKQRLAHFGAVIGLDVDEIASLPIRIVDDAATVTGTDGVFLTTLHAELEARPALVIVDPLYCYQGGSVDAGNLHAAAEVLVAMSGPCTKAGAALVVVNHLAKAAGASLRLTGITQAGSREWVDSWIMVGHRETAEVEAGVFKLETSIGSRQGGGAEWDIDLTVGMHDEATFSYLGEPALLVSRSSERKKDEKDDKEKRRDSYFEEQIFDVLHDNPFTLTREEVLAQVAGGAARKSAAWAAMVKDGHIAFELDGRKKLWGVRPVPPPEPEDEF